MEPLFLRSKTVQELDVVFPGPVTARTDAHLHENQLLFLTWLVAMHTDLRKPLSDGPSTQPLDLSSQAVPSQPPL